jgi:hypothetical protein
MDAAASAAATLDIEASSRSCAASSLGGPTEPTDGVATGDVDSTATAAAVGSALGSRLEGHGTSDHEPRANDLLACGS